LCNCTKKELPGFELHFAVSLNLALVSFRSPNFQNAHSVLFGAFYSNFFRDLQIRPCYFGAICDYFHVRSKANIGSKKYIFRHLSLVAVLSSCHSFGGGDMMVMLPR